MVKLVYCISYLQSLEATQKPDQLSDQEEKFWMMMESIQDCSYGKDGGIDDCYNRIPQEKRCKSNNISEIHNYVTNIIIQERDKMLSGTNHLFNALTGQVPNEEVNQAIHQALFVRNLIGCERWSPMVGQFSSKIKL